MSTTKHPTTWLRHAGVFDDTGWTPHDGGACPVAPDTFVHYVLNGSVDKA